jgi:hypothetical protein
MSAPSDRRTGEAAAISIICAVVVLLLVIGSALTQGCISPQPATLTPAAGYAAARAEREAQDLRTRSICQQEIAHGRDDLVAWLKLLGLVGGGVAAGGGVVAATKRHKTEAKT